MMQPTFEAFCAHAALEAPREACGLVLRLPDGQEQYQPCRNVAENPADDFDICERDWIAAEDLGAVAALCHSHPDETPDPRALDLDGVQEHGLPWFILGRGNALQRVDPTMQPLEGRPFSFGWTDCYSLVRDWFLANHQVRLPDFPREEKFWEKGRSPYVDHFSACGFHQVELAELQDGDLLLLKIQANVPNHAAIYVGEGRILHHLWGRFSARDLYNGALQAATTHFLRFR